VLHGQAVAYQTRLETIVALILESALLGVDPPFPDEVVKITDVGVAGRSAA
jgi:hypothetical protein